MISIIIINFKTPKLTIRCLQSIEDSCQHISYEIIVIDNNSQDNSIKVIKQNHPNVKLIENSYNAGFGRANNLGVQHAQGEYILLLNSDMLLLPEFNLEECIEQLEKDKTIGVLGCKQLNEDGSFQKSTYYDVATIRYLLSYNILWYKLFKPQPKSLDAVMGSFMLMRKKDFDAMGGFDEDFFMYAEELELCTRMKKLNKKVVYYEGYTAIHKHGGSSSGSTWSSRQNMLSNALLYIKVGGWSKYILYHFVFHMNILMNVLLFFTLNSTSKKAYKELYKSYFSNYRHYFSIPFYYTFVKNRQFLKAKL